MKTLMRLAQSNYELKKELNSGVIHIPSNHRELEYEYVGLEEVEMFPSESSEFRGFEIEDMGTELNRVMGSLLTPKERCVIEMSFGLLSYEEMSVKEIGEELLVTGDRIRQIKVRAMDKLKNYFITNL
jgi:RNA polymerase sigma factor (sigma-70 family)